MLVVPHIISTVFLSLKNTFSLMCGTPCFAQTLSHKRLTLVVAQHGNVGPHGMLNLVIEPAMEHVHHIIFHVKVQVKGTQEGTATIAETAHVIASMVVTEFQDGIPRRFGNSLHLMPKQSHWYVARMMGYRLLLIDSL